MFSLVLSIVGVILVGFILTAGIRAAFFGFRAVALGKRAVPASRKHEAPHKRVLVVGDSIAVGVGASTPEKSLVGRLIQDYPHLHIDNHAQNALRLRDIEEKLASNLHKSYDVIILLVGGMDVLKHTSHTSISHHLARIHTHSLRLKTTHIVLISMNNVGNTPMWSFPLSTYFDWRSRLLTNQLAFLSAKYGILHIPLYRTYHKDPLVQSPDLFAEDGTHPNDHGYAIWYEHIKPVIHPHLHHD